MDLPVSFNIAQEFRHIWSVLWRKCELNYYYCIKVQADFFPRSLRIESRLTKGISVSEEISFQTRFQEMRI